MKKKLEIGCGKNKREMEGYETIGIDIIETDAVDALVNLGFERFPFDADTFDMVQAVDVFEHIPKCVWKQSTRDHYYFVDNFDEYKQVVNDYYKNLEQECPYTEDELKEAYKEDDRVIEEQSYMERLCPIMHMMNEIYRVMKHGGELHTEIPFSDWAFNRDPTHVSRFSEDWWHYYKKDDNLYYDQGIVTCNFAVKENKMINDGHTLKTILIAQKADEKALI